MDRRANQVQSVCFSIKYKNVVGHSINNILTLMLPLPRTANLLWALTYIINKIWPSHLSPVTFRRHLALRVKLQYIQCLVAHSSQNTCKLQNILGASRKPGTFNMDDLTFFQVYGMSVHCILRFQGNTFFCWYCIGNNCRIAHCYALTSERKTSLTFCPHSHAISIESVLLK